MPCFQNKNKITETKRHHLRHLRHHRTYTKVKLSGESLFVQVQHSLVSLPIDHHMPKSCRALVLEGREATGKPHVRRNRREVITWSCRGPDAGTLLFIFFQLTGRTTQKGGKHSNGNRLTGMAGHSGPRQAPFTISETTLTRSTPERRSTASVRCTPLHATGVLSFV